MWHLFAQAAESHSIRQKISVADLADGIDLVWLATI